MPNLDVIAKNVDLINIIYNFIPSFKKSIYHGCHPNYMDVMHDIWTIFINSSPNLDVIEFLNWLLLVKIKSRIYLIETERQI